MTVLNLRTVTALDFEPAEVDAISFATVDGLYIRLSLPGPLYY